MSWAVGIMLGISSSAARIKFDLALFCRRFPPRIKRTVRITRITAAAAAMAGSGMESLVLQKPRWM